MKFLRDTQETLQIPYLNIHLHQVVHRKQSFMQDQTIALQSFLQFQYLILLRPSAPTLN